ncbi:hypothetical protein L226DRAFT_527517 [Lentinus tigrinus ALCF2SS1-7]|uniref:Uncharacterized protein n=1 Tax=Lentinus tigrinus ALCF2SS1-6 TaxID=1328759 RepID=A0A5C2RMK3_9APHY|nr:hypothetical protein L227DRAFT_568603 [Lentinus tigrinus ALCF2SS1-6]RPD67981.1 hypothetical protein L226DRAFT_527517 [Lentinus tigrinus ALCF2SS1-7]
MAQIMWSEYKLNLWSSYNPLSNEIAAIPDAESMPCEVKQPNGAWVAKWASFLHVQVLNQHGMSAEFRLTDGPEEDLVHDQDARFLPVDKGFTVECWERTMNRWVVFTICTETYELCCRSIVYAARSAQCSLSKICKERILTTGNGALPELSCIATDVRGKDLKPYTAKAGSSSHDAERAGGTHTYGA